EVGPARAGQGRDFTISSMSDQTATAPEKAPTSDVTQAPQPQPATAAETKPEEPRRVMVIAAHPDDPEFGAGATIGKGASQGYEITYVLVTSGDKGSHDRNLRPEEVAA